jgi:predicted AAA+ superfamily ATPase
MVSMRYLEPHLRSDLQKKMVFLTGPRQCGKTTLAQAVLKSAGAGRYLNWDDPDYSKWIMKGAWSDHERMIVLDEIHKLHKWKSWIKGTYDTQKELHQFLITGSARLDVYQKGGTP